jgi:hypothetical protein
LEKNKGTTVVNRLKQNFPKKTALTILILSLTIVFIFFGCNTSTIQITDTSTFQTIETNQTEKLLCEEDTSKEEEQLSEDEIRIQERTLLEETIKEELGPLFVPLAPLEEKPNPKVKAKGIYVTGNSAGLEQRFQGFIELIDETELNSMVIDVKNDRGLMTYPSEIEMVKEIMKGYFEPVRDIRELISRLEEKNIYPIARIVVFRDPYLPEFHPELAIQKKDGGVWRDTKGFAWVNPYEKKVWDYNIAIAKEAALMGFREIQFDYVRFPEDTKNFDAQVSFTSEKGIAKDEIIRDFLIYAAEQLKGYNVYLSADVFGVIATYLIDKDNIGQNWEEITPVLDYICPMVYPSHYDSGFFGLSVPDANPTETILKSMENAIERNATVKNPADIRPWLQGFTATWVKGNIKYGPKQIREQIDAALERGIEEFFVWNATNQYSADSFLKEEEALKRQDQARDYRLKMGFDYLGRTALMTFEKYLENVSKKNWRQSFPYQATDFGMDFKQFGDWASRWTFDELEFSIISANYFESKTVFEADIILKKGNDETFLEKESFEVYMENNIWKIKPSPQFIEALIRQY